MLLVSFLNILQKKKKIRQGCAFFYYKIYQLCVTGHSRDTLHTSTCFHRLSNQRPITRLPQSTAIYGNQPYSAIFCLPVSTAISTISAMSVTSAEFCQAYRILPSSARTTTWSLFYPMHVLTKQPSQWYIYPFFPFPYFLSLRNVLTSSHSSCT